MVVDGSVRVAVRRAVAVAERRRGSAPLLVLYGVAATIGVAVAARLPWLGDTGLHVAVIEQLGRHLGDPLDPLVGTDAVSPYYSPYTLIQAVIAHTAGVSATGVLRGSALVNALLIASGLHHLVRRLSPARWAPPLVLASILLLQGGSVLIWSGFFGLTSLVVGLSYPSAFALGVTLHLWGLIAGRLNGRGGAWVYPVAGLLAADVALDHQFTAVEAALGCVALVIANWRRLTLTAVAGWSVAVAVAALALAVWPYFSVLTLLSSAAGMDPIHQALYQHVFADFGLALVTGVPVLVLRFARRRTDPLVWLFLLSSAPVTYGFVSGHYSWGRVWPAVLLAGQLAVGIEAAERLAAGPREIRAYVAGAALTTCLMGLWTQSGALEYFTALPAALRAHVSVDRSWGPYSFVTDWVRPGQTVLAGTYHSARLVPADRIFTVKPAYPEPWLPSFRQRVADQHAILDPATSHARRAALLAEYHVRYLIIYRSEAHWLRQTGSHLHELGHSGQFPRDVLYRVVKA